MAKAVLVYDASCPLCVRARDWLARRVPAEALDFVPCQSDERVRRAPGLSEKACMESMCLLLPGRALFEGAEAFPHLLRMMPRWRWFAPVLEAPGVARLTPYFYRWIARRRFVLSGLLRKKAPAATSCDAANSQCE